MDQVKTEQERVKRAMEKISAVLKEERCELEPLILIVAGKLIKTEINCIPLPPEETHPAQPETQGGAN